MQQKICHSALLTQKQKLQKMILSEKWQINLIIVKPYGEKIVHSEVKAPNLAW